VLTVEAHQPHSHRKKGWEDFTDAVIQKLVERESPIAFVLWGKPAQKKKDLILIPPHCIIESAHPSPLSARRGFFGSRPFSKINDWLKEQSQSPIQWWSA
ncbi:MAG: uracil-DNA glycosylase, partial [Planctomycetota bacterium]|nr:uracil-DNA glycosylase [Planctomycetota bacterium]